MASLTAQVDGGSPVTVKFTSAGQFSFPTSFALNGTDDGLHTVELIATDFAGNISGPTSVSFTLDTIPPAQPTFTLAAADEENGSPLATTDSSVTLVGQSDDNITVTLVGTGMTAQSTNTGAFQFPNVPLSAGNNALMVMATDAAGNMSQYQATIERDPAEAGTNQVILWDEITLQAIEQDGSAAEVASRALAIMSASVYDAVNAIDGTPGYYVTLTAPAGASADAAVAAAAYTALSYLYPAQQTFLNSSMTSALAGIPAGQSKTNGESVGQSVANAIIAMRQNDGSTDFVDYTPSSAPGDWQPTAPAFAPAENPQWATLKPFAMTSDSQFRPAGPPALTSQEYADDVNETLNLGSVNSTTRTADETQIAKFWNDNTGTYTPAGHWNAIAEEVAQQQGDSLSQDARLFAELNVAMGDAAIVAWDAKYAYNAWRPITLADGAGTAVNSAIETIANWTPLLTTPPFPEYVSGHSTFSGAAAAVLTSIFGDNYSFTATSVGLPGVTRSYTSFDEAAEEAGMSRIYAGIHFLFSDLDGLASGQALGAYVVQTFSVSRDTTPPQVVVNNVLPSGASNKNVTITGVVTDNLSGVAALDVSADGGAYAPLSFNPGTGAFSFTTSFLTDGSQDGSHTIDFQATDEAGNVALPVAFTFTLGTKAPTLTLTSPTDAGTLTAGATLIGTVTTSGPALTMLNYAFDGGSTIPVAFDASDGSFSQAIDLSKLPLGSHTLVVSAMDAAGNTATQTLHLTQSTAIPLTVTSLTPSSGTSDVGVTFRPIVTFSRPIDPTTLDSSDFYATDTTGAVVPATVVPSDDGTFAWLFFTNPLPGASTITLTVDGSKIKALDGALLDAADNGTAGSKLTQQFTTVSTTPVPGTTLSGIVADPGLDNKPGTTDDVKPGPDGVLMTADDIYLNPIAGATVYILGEEQDAVISGANGSFSLTSVPSGDVKLVIDGRTATNAPSGVFYPEMVFDLTIKPGVANTVMGSMGTSQEQAAEGSALGVYLPRIQTSILKAAGGDSPATISLDPDAAQGLTPEQASEYSITVAPNSLVGMDGQKMSSGQVGFSTVNPSLIRGMLPQGVMQLATTLTIQAPGVATFSTPLQVTFANVYGAAPGGQLDVYSFNHTTGLLEITGTATVSADGMTVTTDPGSGITHPGWFGVNPPGGQAHNDARNPLNNLLQPAFQTEQNAIKVAKDLANIAKDSKNLQGPLETGIEGLVAGAEDGAAIGALEGGVGAIPGAIIGGIIGFIDGYIVGSAFVPEQETEVAKGLFETVQTLDSDLASGASAEQTVTDVANKLQGTLRDLAVQTLNDPFVSLTNDTYNAIMDSNELAKSYEELEEGAGETVTEQSGIGDFTSDSPPISEFDTADVYEGIASDLGWDAPSQSDLDSFQMFTNVLSASQGDLPDSLEQLYNAAGAAGAAATLSLSPSPTNATVQQLQQALSSAIADQNSPLSFSDNLGNNASMIENFAQTVEDGASVPTSGGEVYYDYNYGSIDLRGVSPADQMSVFLPPSVTVVLTVYQPLTGYTGSTIFTTGPTGATNDGGVILGPSQAPPNSYGVPEDIDQVFGQEVTPQDLALLQEGVYPFAGPFSTGVIATLPLEGDSEAVTLSGSPLSSEGQTAYIATGTFGLAIVDASQLQNPVILGQLGLPGDSVDVSVDSSLGIAAVASGSYLNLVDVSNPTQPTLLQSLDIAAGAVQAFEGVAYVGEGNEVVAVDLITGSVLATETFSGGEVDDLGIDQGNLYVLASEGYASHTVYKIGLNGADLPSPSESLTITGHPTFGRMRLFAANGYVYVGASDNNDTQEVPGVEVLQDNRSTLTLVGPSSAIDAFDVATNGSGLALFTGANSNLQNPQVGLLDVSDPTNTNNLLTVFNTPGVANSVAMADGIGFVADGSAGLAVLNYLPFDNKGIPPSASVSIPSSVVVGTDGSNLEVTEGSTIPVLANVSDDVQVRNVELLINGQVVENAVSAPFNLSVTLPTIVQNGSAPVTIQLEAFDTGGNVGLSNTLTIELVRDTTPPQLVSSNIPNGTTVGSGFQTVILQFSKPLDESTVTPSDFQLIAPDSSTLAPESIQFRDNDQTVQLTLPTLELGAYQFVIDAAAITDRSGNPLGSSNLTSSFMVVQYSAVWVNPNGGDWSNAANWQSGVVPGATDSVLIDVINSQGNRPTITFDKGSVEIASLISYNPLVLAGGVLRVDSTMEVDNTFVLAGGTLLNAHVVDGSGSQPITAQPLTESTLDNVYSNVDIDLSQSYDVTLAIENSLTLNGTATIGGQNELDFIGVQTVQGQGTIALDGGQLDIASTGTLTIAPDITVQGPGQVDGGSLINQGSIDVDGAYNSLSVDPTSFDDQGNIGVSNGASLSVSGLTGGLGNVSMTDPDSSLSINGTSYTVDSSFNVIDGQTLDLLGTWTAGTGVLVTVENATLGLGSTFSVAALDVSNSTVEVLGTSTFAQFSPLLTGTNLLAIGQGGVLENAGTTITLNATTGDLILMGGTLMGGTVDASDGADLLGGAYEAGTIDGITLNGNLDLATNLANLTITDGLMLNGTAFVGFDALNTSDTETLDGTGTVDFEYGGDINVDNSGTLTIGPGIQILATDAGIVGSNVVNEGAIVVDGSGVYLQIQLNSFENEGSISVGDGAGMSISELSGNLGNVSLSGADSSLYVNGTGYTVDSSLSISDGQTLALLGTWNLASGDTVTVDGATLGLGSTFSLAGISVTNSTVEVLGMSSFAQFQPILDDGNKLAVGDGGVLNNTDNTISLNASTGGLTLAGGTLEGGTVNSADGSELVVLDCSTLEGELFGFNSSELDGVTLNSDFDLAAASGPLDITDGLTLNGTVSLGSDGSVGIEGTLRFSGDQMLGGTGEVVLFGDSEIEVEDDSTLTIGPNITIDGNSGEIAPLYQASVINQGTIEADSVGDGISIPYGTFMNEGTIGASEGGSLAVNGLTGDLGNVELSGTGSSLSINGTNYTVNSSLSATDGQSLSLLGSWSAATGVTVTVTDATFDLGSTTSLAAVHLASSTLNIQGTYTSAQIQPLLTGNDQLVIGPNGLLDNTGDTISLDAATGDLVLAGGTLVGGTVDASEGAEVVAPAGFYSTLDGVTLNSNLDLTADGAELTVTDGLTLNGTATIGATTDSAGASLTFSGVQSLGGTGDVLFGGGNGDNELFLTVNSVLTIGPNITIHGSDGTISSSEIDGTLGVANNEGTVEADVSGATLSVSSTTFENNGTIGASNGGSLTLTGLTGSLGNVSIVGAGSSLSVDGLDYTVDQSLNISNGQTLALLGTWAGGAGVNIAASNANLALGSSGDPTQVWSTSGAVIVTDGTLVLGGSTESLSGISATSSTIEDDGTYSSAQLEFLLVGNNQLAIGPGGLLDNSGGTIALDASTGDLTLDGGTIVGGTVTASGGVELMVSPEYYSSTLDGVILDANVDLTADGAVLTITDGLTLNGTITIGASTNSDGSALSFIGSQTLNGNCDVMLDNGGVFIDSGSTLTIGPNVMILGGLGTIGSNNGDTIVNQGTISADVAEGALTVEPTSFVNEGSIGASNGGSLTVTGLTGSLGVVSLADTDTSLSVDGTGYTVESSLSATDGETLALLGTWSLAPGATVNVTGATFGLGSPASFAGISLTDSILEVQAAYTYSQIQPLLAGSNQLSIGPGGVLDNSNDTIALDATTGDLVLSGGTLLGGTVTATGGAALDVSGFTYSSTLDSVTLDADLTVQDGGYLIVQHGLTLDGELTISADPDDAEVVFEGTQTLAGTGTIVFGGTNSSGYLILDSGGSGSTLTIGSGITVDCGLGGIISTYDSNDDLVNEGTISEDAGGSISIYVPVENAGTIETANGGSLVAYSLVDNTSAISVGAGSQDTFNGGFDQESAGVLAVEVGGLGSGQFGSLSVSGGASLAGTLDVALVNGYSPRVSDSIPIITFDSSSGQFDTVNVSNLPPGIAATLVYDSTSVSLVFGNAQVAGGAELGQTSAVTDLSQQQLAPVIAEAIDDWEAAGISATELSALKQLQFQIVNLPDAELGMQAGTTVWIDQSADGHGWFLDAGPGTDQEFFTPSGSELHALPGSPAYGMMDLLTVVEHEMGHVLGLAETVDSQGIMDESLETGIRRLAVLPTIDEGAIGVSTLANTATWATTVSSGQAPESGILDSGVSTNQATMVDHLLESGALAANPKGLRRHFGRSVRTGEHKTVTVRSVSLVSSSKLHPFGARSICVTRRFKRNPRSSSQQEL